LKGVDIMATNSTKIQSAMILKFKSGVDTTGKDIIKNQSFSKIKVAATDDELLAVGTALGGLLAFPLVDVSRQDQSTIVNG
jgi:hypothetical protein